LDSHTPAMWERRPDESSTAYDAFLAFLSMPIKDIGNPDNSRTLHNVSRKLGYQVADKKAATSIEQWSAKFSWMERARAYDSRQGALVIAVQDASMAEYQRQVIEKRTEQTIMMNELMNAQLMDLLKRLRTALRQNAYEFHYRSR
jgi:hypothetical protein